MQNKKRFFFTPGHIGFDFAFPDTPPDPWCIAVIADSSNRFDLTPAIFKWLHEHQEMPGENYLRTENADE